MYTCLRETLDTALTCHHPIQPEFCSLLPHPSIAPRESLTHKPQVKETTPAQALPEFLHLTSISFRTSELLIRLGNFIKIPEHHPRQVTLFFQNFYQLLRNKSFGCIGLPIKTGSPPWSNWGAFVDLDVDVWIGATLKPHIRTLSPQHSQTTALTITRNRNTLRVV